MTDLDLSVPLTDKDTWELVPCPYCGAEPGELCHVKDGDSFTPGLRDHDARTHFALGYRWALNDAEKAVKALRRKPPK